MNAAINASKALWEKSDFTLIAHRRVSASWGLDGAIKNLPTASKNSMFVSMKGNRIRL